MMKLMQEGGFPVWFVVLFGLCALGGAIAYALRPTPRRLGFVRGLSATTLFATLAGTSANLGAVFHALAGVDTRHPNLHISTQDGPLMLMLGLGESMSTAILGFTLLALVGLFYAAGSARE